MSFEYFSTGKKPTAFRLKKFDVFFSDEECLKTINAILDEDGKILNFPGIAEDERWKSKQRVRICEDVRYEAQFHCIDNDRTLMLWLIQPNGWYWVDEDGFGFTGDSSIKLYSVIDSCGRFESEFKLFSIDNNRYCNDFEPYLA